jgi:hypothetical protein
MLYVIRNTGGGWTLAWNGRSAAEASFVALSIRAAGAAAEVVSADEAAGVIA